MFNRPLPLLRLRHYAVLVLCCVTPLIAGLVIATRAADALRRTSTANRQLAERAGRYDQIFVSVSELKNAPARAFKTELPDRAAGHVQQTSRVLHNQLAAARLEIEHDLTRSQGRAAAKKIDIVDEAGENMVRSALLAIDAIRRGDVGAAAQSMFVVNAEFEVASAAIVDLRRDIRAEQVASLEAVTAYDQRVRRTERLLFALLLVTIAAGCYYGHRAVVDEVRRRESTRQLSELQLRNFALAQAIEGIATFDKHGRYTWANSNFAKIVGYEAEELPGADLRATLVNADPTVIESATQELIATGRTERVMAIKQKNGRIAHVHAVLVFVTEMKGGFAFLKDVTEQQESEAALRLTEERFAMAMVATRDVIADWDIVGNRYWVSDGMDSVLGNGSIGKPDASRWIDSVHPDDRNEVLERLNAALADEAASWTTEYRLLRGDGTYAYVLDRSCIVRDHDGLPARLITVMTDISARRHAEEELERVSTQNRMILTATADGIFGVGPDGEPTFVNPAAVELLGWQAEELAGRRLDEVLREDGSGGCDGVAIRAALSCGKASSGTTSYNRKDGTSLSLEYTTQPMFDGGGSIAGAVVTFRDVTARLAVQRMKDEFVSVVSHELRTPLTSIRGSLGLIAGGRAGEVPPKVARMIEIAVSNTNRLIRLINEMLDLERLDSGKITLSRELCLADAS